VRTSGSTLRDLRTATENRPARWGRRLAVAAMAVVVVAGATGWLGVRAWTVRADGGGYDLSVTYPLVARSGLDVPWILRLEHPGGFSGPVTIALTADYYDIFEFQGMHPEPSEERSDGEFVYLTFPAPDGDVLRVSLDPDVQPASQVGRDAVTKAIVGGRTVAQVDYETWLVP
jgi:hypothetical protein